MTEPGNRAWRNLRWETLPPGALTNPTDSSSAINWRIFCGMTLLWSGVVSFVVLKLIDLTIGLRVSEEVEIEGLDLALHGETLHD